MKRLFFILLLMTVYNSHSQDRSAYYDALYLKGQLDVHRKFLLNPKTREILDYYFDSAADSDPALVVKINANKYLHQYFAGPGAAGYASPPDVPSFSNSFTSGLNVTNFADGLAKFLVKRFKDELTISFFEKFKKEISNNQELTVLFPETYKALSLIDKDIYQFSLYLNTLREAFVKDMMNFYVDFKKVTALPTFQQFFLNHVEIKIIFDNAFYLIDQYGAGAHPGNVIKRYNADVLISLPGNLHLQTNLRGSVKVLQVLSQSFKSKSKEVYWVSADSVSGMLSNTESRDLYLGLIAEKGKAIHFNTQNGDKTFYDMLDTAHGDAAKIAEYSNFATELLGFTSEIDEWASNLKRKKNSEIDYNDYYRLFNSGFGIIEKGLSFPDLQGADIANADKGTDQKNMLIDIGKLGGGLFVDVRTKNYSSAVVNLLGLTDIVFAGSVNNALKTKILKYGTFAAAVAQAKNSDEVQAAIESAVLPVGSASIKKKTDFNIAVNAYLGGFYGYEYLAEKTNKKLAAIAGIYAPIGVAFSWGLNGEKLNYGSLTALLNVIDLGAIASFRFKDSTTEKLPEVTLQNILAPGAGLIYGLPGLPVSIGVSYQLGPALREINAVKATTDRINNRWQVFLGVDIPLFNLYTKSK